MEIVVNAPQASELGSLLLNDIFQKSGVAPTATFCLESFFKLMTSKISSRIIAVFLISSLNELNKIADKKMYLGNSRYIFILPEDDPLMISKALSLHPRFLAYAQDGVEDVCSVIKKLTTNILLEAI